MDGWKDGLMIIAAAAAVAAAATANDWWEYRGGLDRVLYYRGACDSSRSSS